LPTGGGPNANLVASASLRVEVLRPGVPLSALSALDGDEEGANELWELWCDDVLAVGAPASLVRYASLAPAVTQGTTGAPDVSVSEAEWSAMAEAERAPYVRVERPVRRVVVRAAAVRLTWVRTMPPTPSAAPSAAPASAGGSLLGHGVLPIDAPNPFAGFAASPSSSSSEASKSGKAGKGKVKARRSVKTEAASGGGGGGGGGAKLPLVVAPVLWVQGRLTSPAGMHELHKLATLAAQVLARVCLAAVSAVGAGPEEGPLVESLQGQLLRGGLVRTGAGVAGSGSGAGSNADGGADVPLVPKRSATAPAHMVNEATAFLEHLAAHVSVPGTAPLSGAARLHEAMLAKFERDASKNVQCSAGEGGAGARLEHHRRVCAAAPPPPRGGGGGGGGGARCSAPAHVAGGALAGRASSAPMGGGARWRRAPEGWRCNRRGLLRG
jgi:hypothetical protein